MPTAWRIVSEVRAATPFDGAGARRHGGRWNSPGLPVVYTAGSRALAALEVLVHLPRPVPPMRFRLFPVEIPDALIEAVSDPAVLRAAVLPSVQKPTQRFGDDWLTSARSVALRVPSAVIPEEPNYLLNPAHPAFARLKPGAGSPFAFDPRLLA
ncbi:MAG: RES family NAD+ phosphorylase [Opitutales bacterium]|nr:RES family NAD+ phosphorylase [Opitutales bacterium]